MTNTNAPASRYSLRPYQAQAQAAALEISEFVSQGIISIPTGGGKTVVAAKVVEELVSRGEQVLWVTRDWRLLQQASETLDEVVPSARQGRIGGDHEVLQDLKEASMDVDIAFTTLATFMRRRDELDAYVVPQTIVWDECHWADGAETGDELRAYAEEQGATLLGLTATPRGNSTMKTIHASTFEQLQRQGWLAKPIMLEPVKTGITWKPTKPQRGDFTDNSLRELAQSHQRNRCIVDYYKQHRARLGSTIVFACNIDHANVLARMLGEVGAHAGVVHSQSSLDDLEAYKAGALDVLVNVSMLTHGFDHPATRTVMMARPTASSTLYAQMIGRGSRLHAPSNKTHFHIVDFADNVTAHHERVIRATDLLESVDRKAGQRRTAERRAARMMGGDFKVEGRLMRVASSPLNAPALQGMSYRCDQTFGVEIELTSNDFDGDSSSPLWLERANGLIDALTEALGEDRVAQSASTAYHGSSEDFRQWSVEYDGSCGWEVVGPKLKNVEGLRELAAACDALNDAAPRLGLRVNAKTGLHVHFGWHAEYEHIQSLLFMADELEPLLASLVAPSRLADFNGRSYDLTEANEYIRPVLSHPLIRAVIKAKTKDEFGEAFGAFLEDEDARYSTVNITPKSRISTIEVRMHSGTLESEKVLLWVSLWMQLLHANENGNYDFSYDGVSERTSIQPQGCIVSYLAEHTPIHRHDFLKRLDQRRQQVLQSWKRAPELKSWVAGAAEWVRVPESEVEWLGAAD